MKTLAKKRIQGYEPNTHVELMTWITRPGSATRSSLEGLYAVHIQLAVSPPTPDGRTWDCSCQVCRSAKKIYKEAFRRGRLFGQTPEGKLLTAIFEGKDE